VFFVFVFLERLIIGIQQVRQALVLKSRATGADSQELTKRIEELIKNATRKYGKLLNQCSLDVSVSKTWSRQRNLKLIDGIRDLIGH